MERYPLSEMQYQGSISAADPGQMDGAINAPVVYALVKLPNGEIYRLKLLETLGKHYGQLIRIEPERLYIAEILPSCQETSEWKVRMNYLDSPATLSNPEYRVRTTDCIDKDDIVVMEENLNCTENYCAIQFTLHNQLHHPVDVDYSINTSFSTKSVKGIETSTNSNACDGVQQIGAKQRITLKKYIKTQSSQNTVSISTGFSTGQAPSRNRCLDSKD